jgi:hypothetical protein
MSVWSREEHAAEPVQFGTPPARFSSFDECFCLIDCFQGFAGAIRQMQSFHLSDQDKWQRDNQAACPTLVDFRPRSTRYLRLCQRRRYGFLQELAWRGSRAVGSAHRLTTNIALIFDRSAERMPGYCSRILFALTIAA